MTALPFAHRPANAAPPTEAASHRASPTNATSPAVPTQPTVAASPSSILTNANAAAASIPSPAAPTRPTAAALTPLAAAAAPLNRRRLMQAAVAATAFTTAPFSIAQTPEKSSRSSPSTPASATPKPAPATRPAASPAAPPQAPSAVRGKSWSNWSGLQKSQPLQWATPGSEEEIANFLRHSSVGGIRCVGSGHSFTPLVPTDTLLVSLDRLSGLVAVDAAAGQAVIRAGTRLALLARRLDEAGVGFRNLPDVDVQTLAGAIATGTHGTGAALPAIHADVVGLRLITASGEVLECSEQQRPDLLAAARVSLGALGIVSQITMRVLPAYNLHRRVWLEPVEQLLARAPQLAAQHRNFEFYLLPHTGYAAAITHDAYSGNEVKMPESIDEDALRDLRRLRDWLGRWPALRRWLAGKLIARNEPQEAQNRSWRLLSTQRPTRFNETECHVPRDAGIACVREVLAALERRSETFFPVEFRYVAADDAWLSPFYQRPSCSIAVHSAADEAHDYFASEIEPIFRRHQGRPHWGKLHTRSSAELAALYPRWADFAALRHTLDPQGRLLNPHLRQLFGANP